MSRPFVGLGVPMVVRFGPQDLGRRVTLRRQLVGSAPGEPSLGDVVGVLEGWDQGVLTVRRRTGETVEVPEITIVAGRVVAPERSADDVGAIASATWVPRESEPLGEWTLRAHGGVTHRANSALVAGDPGRALPEAAAAVRDWYADRGLPPTVMVPVRAKVTAGLGVLGWTELHRSVVMTTALGDVEGVQPVADGFEVRREDDLPADWPAVLARLTGEGGPLFRDLLTSGPLTTFVTTRDAAGRPVAVARGSVADGWLNLTNVEVVAGMRGRRLADSVIGPLVAWAREQRATHAFLQTQPGNTAAVRLYERLGFTRHHEYAYLVAPD